MTITVDPCPRCQGRHEHMGFTAFTNAESAMFQWFAMCPVKNEPVLVRYRAADDSTIAYVQMKVPS